MDQEEEEIAFPAAPVRRASGGTTGSNLAGMAAAALSLAFLLGPAIWNRFPLLQYDTGGYIARWYEGYLVPSRSTVYGLFLQVLQWPDFWLAVLVNSALTIWVIALLLRAYGLPRPGTLVAAITTLSIVTTLPWLTSILLTDIFCGLGVLALFLLMLKPETLTGTESGWLVVLVAFSAATHSATFGVFVALVLAGGIISLVRRRAVSRSGMVRGFAALALGAAMLLTCNFAFSGRVAWTPGGYGILFGRLLEDGIVKRFLDEHCPDQRLVLCDHRDELPPTADAFLWGQSVFDKLGRFAKLDPEMRMIVIESMRAYPGWQAEAAIIATTRQLVSVATGEGVVKDIWHSHGMIERHVPTALSAMRAARQQRDEITFDAINRLHVPVALASMLALLGVIALALRRREQLADLGLLAAATAVTILANAMICGIISNPHDRYGARLAWVATLVVLIAFFRMFGSSDAENVGGT